MWWRGDNSGLIYYMDDGYTIVLGSYENLRAEWTRPDLFDVIDSNYKGYSLYEPTEEDLHRLQNNSVRSI